MAATDAFCFVVQNSDENKENSALTVYPFQFNYPIDTPVRRLRVKWDMICRTTGWRTNFTDAGDFAFANATRDLIVSGYSLRVDGTKINQIGNTEEALSIVAFAASSHEGYRNQGLTAYDSGVEPGFGTLSTRTAHIRGEREIRYRTPQRLNGTWTLYLQEESTLPGYPYDAGTFEAASEAFNGVGITSQNGTLIIEVLE